MSNPEKPELMIALPYGPDVIARFAEVYAVHHVPVVADRAAEVARVGAGVRAVVTNGSFGWSAEFISAMPKLEIISASGAGYENIDVAAARARGIAVTHGPGTNDSTVADHALALLFASVRALGAGDQAVRAGRWMESRQARPSLFGKRLGILGLGRIGLQIAQRVAGFEMTVAYHNRNPRADVPYRYVASVLELAAEVDFLVLVAPGGAGTRHMVNRAVLDALGPKGYLVNVGRGSVVDQAALGDALREGRVAGAALDVLEGEPEVPAQLLEAPNLLLTPHIAGRSPESVRAGHDLLLANFAAHFAGRPVLTPVPE